MEKQMDTLLLAIVVAFGLFLVAGLIVIPAMHEAQARNAIVSERNKGQQGSEQGRGSQPNGEAWCTTIQSNLLQTQTRCFPFSGACLQFESGIQGSRTWHVVAACHDISG